MSVNKKIMNNIEDDAKLLETVTNEIVSKYTKELDEYTEGIKGVLDTGTQEITNIDLNKILMRLCSYAYFIGTKQELLALRTDIAQALFDERYNQSLLEQEGTVAVKQSLARNATKEENIVNIIYERAYKIMKNKYNSINTFIDSIKKIQTVRLKEMELGLKING